MLANENIGQVVIKLVRSCHVVIKLVRACHVVIKLIRSCSGSIRVPTMLKYMDKRSGNVKKIPGSFRSCIASFSPLIRSERIVVS